MTLEKTSSTIRLALGATALTLIGSAAHADQVINDDLIVTFSACIGNDCVNGESFGFDTLRLKENNLRINFADTSNSASFPTRDWRIVANDTSNGGDNYLAFEDTDVGTQPFIVDAGAGNNALNVSSSGGNVGLGTASPVVELHVVDGDSPTIRLEQNGASGFTPQTWDMAGNETNFFVRDVTNGSQLPLRIRPGADSNSIFVDADNDVGMGTAAPEARLHVFDNAGSGAQDMLWLENNGNPQIVLQNNNNGAVWEWGAGQNFVVEERSGANGVIFTLTPTGNLILGGTLTTTGGATCSVTPCDAVFDPEVYDVPSIEEHAAFMWENKYLPAVGPTGVDTPVNVSERVLTMLNELEHAHIYIEQLNDELKAQKAEIAALSAQIAR